MATNNSYNRGEMQKNIVCTANKEMQIPSLKRKSKIQDTGQTLIHSYSFTTLSCKHQLKISPFKEEGYHSFFCFHADSSAG